MSARQDITALRDQLLFGPAPASLDPAGRVKAG
jgi:hypothetical protein